jgi:Ser/Thr protein kinase RdoA (MazF antagonist)
LSTGIVRQCWKRSETFANQYPDSLIRYDRRYSERLLDYAVSNLTDYVGRTADRAVASLSGRWREVAVVHQRDEFYNHDLRVPIHGDYNCSNIHAHRENDNQLKVVDWEWAGVGLPHADLAALVKSVRREDHPALLKVFLEEDRRLDAEQHRRLFHWCQLERRLLDAAFLARQQLVSARRVSWLQAEIRRAASDVLAAVEWLDAATHAPAATSSIFGLGGTIAAGAEGVGAFGERTGVEDVADRRSERDFGSRRDLAPQRFEVGKQVLIGFRSRE